MKNAVMENFKQFRNFCLQKKLYEMTGIATNFGMWIITKYNKKDEMSKGKPFMISHPIEIMDIVNDSKICEE